MIAKRFLYKFRQQGRLQLSMVRTDSDAKGTPEMNGEAA